LDVEDPALFAGYRVCAIDGTLVLLPKAIALLIKYGATTPVEGKIFARISLCVDILNGIVLDGEIAGHDTGERKLALNHVKRQPAPNALNLFDRGYWSAELASEMIGRGQKFLFRLSANAVPAVVSGEKDCGEFSFTHGKAEYTVRYYRFRLQSGETEYLATNLSREEVPDPILAELYHLRWGIETKYDELKNRLQFENFSGKNVNAVEQDFYASLIIMNLTSFSITAANAKVQAERENKSNKYVYKPNGNMAVGILKDRLIKVIIEGNPEARGRMFDTLIKDISRYVIPIRPDRHANRSTTTKARRTHRKKHPL
jgi:hypothetical protein